MLSGLGFQDRADAEIVRSKTPDPPESSLLLGGHFRVECIKPDGSIRWVDDAKNSVLNVALDYVLNTALRNGTPVAAWYMGLVDNAGYTQFQAADTQASHTGWAENLAFTGAARIAWAPGASSGQSITNATPISFVMTAAAVIRGLFISSDPSSNGGGVTLFAEAAFATGSQTVAIADTIKATYTLAAATS